MILLAGRIAHGGHRRKDTFRAKFAGVEAHSGVMVSGYYDEPAAWANFRRAVQRRLASLGQLPGKVQDVNAVPALTQTAARERGRREIRMQMTAPAYVDPDRIAELKEI